MSEYLKPQTPLNIKDQYFYPLTTDDQVIMSDGRRLSEIDFNNTPFIFITSGQDFPEYGETGKFYIRNNYIYIWNGSSYQTLGVQSVNGKVGRVNLTANDVNALEHPSSVQDVALGSFLVIKNIINGRIEVGFAAGNSLTAGFIEFTEDQNIEVENRNQNTLYGLQLRELNENASTSISYSG